MGTFADMYRGKDAYIPEEKKAEFIERVEKVFQAGGMMERDCIQMYGKKLPILRKAKMKEGGMDFYYNYFEDTCWENAGFSKDKCQVWSNKIGWGYFSRAVIAAYVLEEIYTEGVVGVTVNGETVPYGTYVAWLNYLFDEDFRVKNYDSWKLFEALHEEKYFRDDLINWRDCGPYGYAFVAGCEMCAVKYGTAEVFKRMHVEDNDGNIIFIRAMKMMLECLEKYQKSSLLTKEEQLEELMGYIRKHYEGKKEEFEDETIRDLSIILLLSSASAFLVKAIAEKYEKDFWELWEEVKHVAKREMEEYYGKDAVSYSSLTTVELFRQSEDDLIPWWGKEGEIVFSQELENWFVWLKERYEEILAKGEKMEHPLKKVAELMEYAFMQYYNIFTFEEFWEETTEHLSDERYQALWLLYEELLMDEQLQKEGEIIIDPDASVRQLKCHWDFMSQEEKNNRARVTYRRYMALVANKELRQKVFGF